MKNKFFYLLLFSCLYLGCDLFEDKAIIANQAQSTKEINLSELSSEFKRLRNIPGHFQGGSWNDEVDSWMGAKHRVMIALAQELGQDRYKISDLQFYMGQPDRLIGQTDPLFAQINQWIFKEISTASPPDLYFLYEWRGDHDFLIFACRSDRILFSTWRYVGE